MSDDYTNMDLDTADELLVNAGHPAIAKALRFQTQGNRNLIQGEWGSRVVGAFEHILNTRVVDVLASVQSTLDHQHDLVQQILAMQKASDANAKRALAVAKETGRGLKKLNDRVERIEASIATLGHDVLIKELNRSTRLRNVAFIELLMAQHPELAAEAERRAAEGPDGR